MTKEASQIEKEKEGEEIAEKEEPGNSPRTQNSTRKRSPETTAITTASAGSRGAGTSPSLAQTGSGISSEGEAVEQQFRPAVKGTLTMARNAAQTTSASTLSTTQTDGGRHAMIGTLTMARNAAQTTSTSALSTHTDDGRHTVKGTLTMARQAARTTSASMHTTSAASTLSTQNDDEATSIGLPSYKDQVFSRTITAEDVEVAELDHQEAQSAPRDETSLRSGTKISPQTGDGRSTSIGLPGYKDQVFGRTVIAERVEVAEQDQRDAQRASRNKAPSRSHRVGTELRKAGPRFKDQAVSLTIAAEDVQDYEQNQQALIGGTTSVAKNVARLSSSSSVSSQIRTGVGLPHFKDQVNSPSIIMEEVQEVENERGERKGSASGSFSLPDFKDQVNSRSTVERAQEVRPLCKDDGPDFKDQVRPREEDSATGVEVQENHNAVAVAVPVEDPRMLDFSEGNMGSQPIVSIDDTVQALEEAPNDNSNYRRQEEAKNELDNSETILKSHLGLCQRKHVCYFIVAVVLILAIVVAGVCGSGTCTSDSPSKTSGETESRASRPEEEISAIVDYINNITLSNKTLSYPASADFASAEEQSLGWVIDDDPLQLTVDTAAARFRLGQRYALATFFYQLTPQAWGIKDKWLNEDECTWFGLACIELDKAVDGVGLQNVVSGIKLPTNGLQGQLPEDLSLLTSLRDLGLEGNSIDGTLPGSIGSSLLDLEELSIWGNAITGPIPSSFGNLGSLLRIFCRRNNLNGTLPDSIGQMTSLVRFVCEDNLFTGSLPSSIGNWSQLENLNLLNNDFTGVIPETISAWQNIVTANFGDNRFSGTMPTFFCNATALTTLVADCMEVVCECCTVCEDS